MALRPCLQARTRRHRVETKGLGLPFGTLAGLAQDEKPCVRGRDAGEGGGLELEHGRTSPISPGLVPYLP